MFNLFFKILISRLKNVFNLIEFIFKNFVFVLIILNFYLIFELFLGNLDLEILSNQILFSSSSIFLYLFLLVINGGINRNQILSQHLPIFFLKRLVFNFYINFISIENFYTILLMIFLIFKYDYPFIIFQYVIFYYFIGYLFVYNFRILLQCFRANLFWPFIFELFIVSISFLICNYLPTYLNYYILLFAIIQILFLIIIEKKALYVQESAYHGGVSTGSNLGIRLLFLFNKYSALKVLAFVIIKILFLQIFYTYKINKFSLFLYSPILLYTYFGNNIWGFFPNVFARLQANLNRLIFTHLKIIIFPLLFDFLIDFYFLTKFDEWSIRILIFILVNHLVLFVIATFSSLVLPLKINIKNSIFRIKNSTNILASLISIINVYFNAKNYIVGNSILTGLYLIIFIMFLFFFQIIFKFFNSKIFRNSLKKLFV